MIGQVPAVVSLFLWDNHISAVTLSADWLVLVSAKGWGHL